MRLPAAVSSRMDTLVLDDQGLAPDRDEDLGNLLEIMGDRKGLHSTARSQSPRGTITSATPRSLTPSAIPRLHL